MHRFQVDHTLVEFNKLISLVGITLLLIALLLPAAAASLQVIHAFAMHHFRMNFVPIGGT